MQGDHCADCSDPTQFTSAAGYILHIHVVEYFFDKSMLVIKQLVLPSSNFQLNVPIIMSDGYIIIMDTFFYDNKTSSNLKLSSLLNMRVSLV